MYPMPFIQNLQRWALQRPDHAAVVVPGRRLNYSALAAVTRRPAPSRLQLIDTGDGAELALALCAAVSGTGVAAVLDAGWPAELRKTVSAAAQDWAARTLPDDGVVAENSTFLLGFSSGTSGVPKAFSRSRASWGDSITASISHFGLEPSDVTLVPGPPSASMNLYALAECLASGSTFVGLGSFSPRAALAAVKDNAVTRLVAVPSVLGLLAEAGLAARETVPGLRSIVCAGSPMSAETLQAAKEWAPHARIQHYYGAAELGFVAATDVREGLDPTVAGAAFPGVEIDILDDAGNPVGRGHTGSIFVRSPYVCDGYAWGGDQLAFAAQAIDNRQGTWCTVRDQGFLDEEGLLHVLGRESDMLLVAGNNVYPQELEAVLSSGGPGLSVVAAGVPDARRGHRIVVGLFGKHAEVHDGLPELRARARTLPASHRPAEYYFLAEMPHTVAGKLSRAMLVDWIESGDRRAQRIQ